MTTDDDMREIEAALDKIIGYAKQGLWEDGSDRTLLALIRQKLPQTDAEHERAVEAWTAEATRISIHCGGAMHLVQRLRDEGASLMRAGVR